MAIELQSTLDENPQIELDKTKAYMVDFSRLNSVNDLMVILSAMGITFPATHPLIEHLKPFLKLDTPLDLPTNKTK